MPIVTFRNKVTRNIAAGIASKEARRLLPGELHAKARIRLATLNRARLLGDLSITGFHLEKLAGDRLGQYSIRINDKYRICFEWNDALVNNVEIVDYHSCCI